MRPIDFRDLRRFCEVDGWTDKDIASGRHKDDHHRYTKTLPNGDQLFTRVSHGRGELGDPALISTILKDQLQVTEAEFWDAVDKGVPPIRGKPAPERSGTPLPAGLVFQVRRSLPHIPEEEIWGWTHDWLVWVWSYYQTYGRYPPPEDVGDWTPPS